LARRTHVPDATDWTGWDRLQFANDYPHRDYDYLQQLLPMPPEDPKQRDSSSTMPWRSMDGNNPATANHLETFDRSRLPVTDKLCHPAT
jgi:hypothetical protein